MVRQTLFVLLMVFCIATAAEARLVACVGDSITYGSGISDRLRDGYPAQLERMLKEFDPAWEVENFGVSGATLLSKGDRPYIRESAYQSARASNPDIVIIKLGTNDSKPQNWAYANEYVSDYIAMIEAFRALPSGPVVWICKPVPAFYVNFTIRPQVIHDEILPMIDEISAQTGAPVIDLYTALEDHGNLFPDGIHPNAEGAGLMAEAIVPYLTGVRRAPDFNRDGVVNLLDFAHLAWQWMALEPALDIAPAPDGDGAIDWLDLAGVGMYWLKYPNLVAHLPLDEAEGDLAADVLGRFDGTLHGGPLWRPGGGAIGGALELDGIDDFVSTRTIVRPTDGPFTVFVWVKGGRPGQVILSQADASGAGVAWIATDAATGVILTYLTDGGRITVPLVSEQVVTDGRWHRIRLVWTGQRRHLYVDGREVAADARDLGSLRPSSAGFLLGAGEGLAPGTFWSGMVDDVRFYDRAVLP
ncbi:MAG: GDSL-type esterase/lipase family protein [Sedimentisphaerales bacterium]|jgi:lysophospholipase L1-like esterase|nr:GDSL-type esterase/lipase family protein [Sedimentisphaerales bacterium]